MLTLHQLEVTIEALTPLALDPYCGSALRGAFFRALWDRFCANHEAETCYACPLHEACPVSSLMSRVRISLLLRTAQMGGMSKERRVPLLSRSSEMPQSSILM